MIEKINEQITAQEIKAEREALGLTQNGLAEIFGVSSTTVYRWESELVKPEASGMMRLAFQAIRVAQLNQDADLIKLQNEVEKKFEKLREVRRGRPVLTVSE